MITGSSETTAGTLVQTLRKPLDFPMSAPRAVLRSVGWIHPNQLPTSIFSFVGQELSELRPRRIQDALRKTMVVNHLINLQIFNAQNPKPVYQFSAFLMSEVQSSVSYSFVDSGNDLLNQLPLRCPLLDPGELSLGLGQSLLVRAEEPGIFDTFSIRQGSEVFQAHINSNRGFGFPEFIGFTFDRETNKPLARRTSSDSAVSDPADDRPVQFDFHRSDLGKIKVIFGKFKSRLRIGNGTISPPSFKSGIARVFLKLHPTKERFKRQVHSHRYILKHLRVNTGQRFPFLFELRYRNRLIVVINRFLLLFPGIPSLFEEVIVKPATFFKRRFQTSSLSIGRENPIFKSFKHILYVSLISRVCQ